MKAYPTSLATKVVITFVDGTTKTLIGILDPDPSKFLTSAKNYEKHAMDPHLTFALRDCVLDIPLSSVKSMRMYAAPPQYAQYAMPNMQEVNE